MKINSNYLKLKPSYLFKTIGEKVSCFQKKHPDADIISMGIGDVTLPLCPGTVDEMVKAAKEMGKADTFHGYPESFGEDFLISAIYDHYTKHIKTEIKKTDIVVTCGAKEDTANILDIFSADNTVLIPDPVYPVYVDTNIMLGRKIKYISANEDNRFLPIPSKSNAADIIYICSPNNPTGSAYSYSQLKEWVDFALKNKSVILYDAAYEMFIQDKDCPRSIFEIEGASKCAIEFGSFSKTAGFTGMRCGYTVISEELTVDGVKILDLWKRRQSTKFNGVSYVIQRAAASVFSDSGYSEIKNNIAYYLKNTKTISETLDELSITYFGGENSPYVWLKCPDNTDSWKFFDFLLENCYVVGTPGEGFGENGKNFFRLSGFSTHEKTTEAMNRLKKCLAGNK